MPSIYTENFKNHHREMVPINNSNHDPKFEWKNDILWYKGRIYLNSKSKFKAKVMKDSHDSPTAGHVGFFKSYYNARRSLFWKGMQKDIQHYVAECDKCQRNNFFLTLGLLHPLHIPNQKCIWFHKKSS